MILLYGTSHISQESISEIKKVVDKEKPDLIAIELDELRLKALLGEKGIKRRRTPLFFLMEKVQKYFGNKVEVIPGREMLEAYHVAQERKISVALIDQDITLTMSKIKKIPLKERLKIIFAMLAVFVPIKKSKSDLEIDLQKVPSQEIIDTVLDQFKTFLPKFYQILIEDRNKLMARKLELLETEYEKIIAFVGAGHKKGMEKLLKT